MNDQEYKQWIVALTELSEVQLNDLSNRVKILSFATAKSFNGKSDFAVRMINIICATFNKLGVECPNPNTLRRSSAYVASRDKISDLANFLDKISSQKIVQDAILQMAIQLLYRDLVEWQGTVSSHTILQHIHRIPAILNKHFPGYSESGLLHKLVKV